MVVRIVLATLAVAGCSFEHGLVAQPDAQSADPSADAGAAPRTCKYPDPALRLCIEFDDKVFSPVATDLSPYGLNAKTSHVTEWQRGGQPAAATSVLDESQLKVDEHAMLDITPAITLETWVNVPIYHFAALVGNYTQYGMTLDSEGRIACRIGSLTATTPQSIGTGTWRHVACVFDGQALRVYVDGAPQACRSQQLAIPIAGTQGTWLAYSYTGALDDIRIYARALAATEICSHADKTSCVSACPSGGRGGD